MRMLALYGACKTDAVSFSMTLALGRMGGADLSLPRQCYHKCPPGSTSQAGSKSLLDCKCQEGFTGPDGGPCARTREGVASFAAGTAWVFGSDNFSSAARRLNLPLTPCLRPRMDDALRHDLEAWPLDAARFWAQQGDAAETFKLPWSVHFALVDSQYQGGTAEAFPRLAVPFPWSLRDALYRTLFAVWAWEQADLPKSTNSCICMYVCMYACMYVCMYVCMY